MTTIYNANGQSSVPSPYIFNVSNSGSGLYIINGQSNPTLTITEGQTYTFNINAVGHPFWIKTVFGIGTSNTYNDGITNNGTDNGVITFVVPYSAPSTLYYNCQYHISMGGTINIINVPTPTPTPIITPALTLQSASGCSAPSTCGKYGAFVDCLVNVVQGESPCFSIQIYNENLERANLAGFNIIQVVVTDVGNNIVGIFSDPKLIGSELDQPLTIDDVDGILSFCIPGNLTLYAMTGKLLADIRLSYTDSSGNTDNIYITCLLIGNVKATRFNMSSGLNGGSSDLNGSSNRY